MPIDLVVEERFHRAAPGGMGGTKAAGNYSPVLLTQRAAKVGPQLPPVLPLSGCVVGGRGSSQGLLSAVGEVACPSVGMPWCPLGMLYLAPDASRRCQMPDAAGCLCGWSSCQEQTYKG